MLCYQVLIWNEDKISATSYAVLFSYRDARIQQLNLMKIYFHRSIQTITGTKL